MIQFDKNGYLVPYEIIEISLADFEQTFVTSMPEKEQRSKIFATYLQYLSELFEVVGKDFFQFVNGSFTTTKELPNDIDFVTFVDYRICRSCEEKIFKLGNRWENKKLINCYFVPFSYPGHPRFIQSQLAYDYWKNLFSSDREDFEGKSNPKGLIKISFQK